MILSRIQEKVKDKKEIIILVLIIFLVCLFAFSLGIIFCRLQTQKQEQLKFYDNSATFSHCYGWQSQMG